MEKDDGGRGLWPIYSLGGALILILDISLGQLARRRLDGSLAVPLRHIKRSLLIEGKAVRVRHGSTLEPQFRWNCPEYKDAVIGYQNFEWVDLNNESSSVGQEKEKQERFVFLFSDMVFESAQEALKQVLQNAKKRPVPKCILRQGMDSVVFVKPLFNRGNEPRPVAEYINGGEVLAIAIEQSEKDLEDKVNEELLHRAAKDVLQIDDRLLSLVWDPVRNGLVLVVKKHNPVKVHLTVEQSIKASMP